MVMEAVAEKPALWGKALSESARLLPGEINENGQINVNIKSLEETLSYLKELGEARRIKVSIWTKEPFEYEIFPNASISFITDSYETPETPRKRRFSETIRFHNFFAIVPDFDKLMESPSETFRIEIWTPHEARKFRPEIEKVFESKIPDNWKIRPRTATYGKMRKEDLF